MGFRRSLAVLGGAVTVTVTAFGAAAWACVPVAVFTATPTEVQAGQSLTLSGKFFNANNVVVRFNALDGPVLATLTPPKASGAPLTGSVTIPADTKPGRYVLIATQEPEAGRRPSFGVPARAMITVAGAGGAPVVGAPLGSAETGRPVSLVRDDSVGLGTLALVGVGVAGMAMFAAGMSAYFTGRRRDVPEAVRAG